MESDSPRSSRLPSWFSEESPARLVVILAVLGAGALHPTTRWGVVVVGALCLIVGLHEAGHLVAARRTGIGADEYWIGFGPRLWSRRSENLHWGLRLLPLGGYVRIIGMDRAPTEHPSGISYADATWPRKICVAGSGPAVNIALATVAMFVALVVIGPPGVTTAIESVVDGSPAATAGVEPGDRITHVDGIAVNEWEQIPELIGASQGPVTLGLDRNGAPASVVVDPTGGGGRLGFALASDNVTRTPGDAIGETASFMVDSTSLMLTSLDDLPAQALPTEAPAETRAVSPVGIAQIASQSNLWSLAVLFVGVNLFLAIFNLLPIPPFDGGHIVVATAERLASAVVGRSVSIPRAAIVTVGYGIFVLLAAVGLSSIFRDIVDPIQM